MNTPLGALLASLASLGIVNLAAASDRPASVRADAARATRADGSFCTTQLHGTLLMRTELVFGMSRSSGAAITEAEFQEFIDARVTARFPDGLTVMNGNGQFKTANGTIIQEKAKLLVLLYPFSAKSSRLVEEIRADYKGQFQQESVLRIDMEMCASF